MAHARPPLARGRGSRRLLPLGVVLFVAAFARARGRAHADEAPAAPAAGLRAALEGVDHHGVRVAFRFQPDADTDAPPPPRGGPLSLAERHLRDRTPLRVPGFVVRDRRTVVLADVFVRPGTVRSVTVETRSGVEVAAGIEGFLPRCAGLVVRAERDLDVEPLAFANTDGASDADGTPAFVGSIAEGPDGRAPWVEALVAAHRTGAGGDAVAPGLPRAFAAGLRGARGDEGGAPRGSDAAAAELLARADGAPLGLRLRRDATSGGPWRGSDVLADVARAVPFERLRATAQAIAEAGLVPAVRVEYRPATAGEAPLCDPDVEDPRARGLGEPPPGETAFGLALAPDLVLVPRALSDAWVRRVRRVLVGEGDAAVEATFEGRVPDLGAFVVRLRTPSLREPAASSASSPAPGAALLVHRAIAFAGGRHDTVSYERSLGTARGFRDRRWLSSEGTIEAGAVLLDLDGAVLGVAVALAPADADAPGPSGAVALTLRAVGGTTGLLASLDRRVRPEPEAEAGRLPWLGVETEPVRGPWVARALGVESATHDGARGLVVNRVYEGSPAARAGLARDDVLLEARRRTREGPAAPVDLVEAREPATFPDDSEVPRPWRPRRNALVRLLATWGVGTEYEVDVLRAGGVVTLSLVVELAPRDATTALRWRDAGTGVAVQEVTYEVREALRLGAGPAGVLVAEVEEGSAASLARILRNEVVREVDGRAIDGPEAFLARLAAARAEGRSRVRMTVLRLDRTRLADVRLDHDDAGATEATNEGAATPNAEDTTPPGTPR